MRRQGQYADSGVNPMVAAQMQQMSAQRMQHSSATSHFTGGSDPFRPGEEHQYMSSKAEGQWQWDRDAPRGSNQLPSQVYKEGHGTDVSRTLYEGQMSDSKLGMEMQANKDPRAQAHQDELEARFQNSTLPQTFEGLEQKFFNDIMNMTEEQQEAEDRENARHKERLNEINAQYQEKLLAVRARQATHREESLRKEPQARHQQYQQASVSSYQNKAGASEAHGFGSDANAVSSYQNKAGASEAHGFGSDANAVSPFGDAHHGYPAGRYDSYAERSDFGGGARGRGQYPGGQAYNSRGRYF